VRLSQQNYRRTKSATIDFLAREYADPGYRLITGQKVIDLSPAVAQLRCQRNLRKFVPNHKRFEIRGRHAVFGKSLDAGSWHIDGIVIAPCQSLTVINPRQSG
jgi:hypothetical protein